MPFNRPSPADLLQRLEVELNAAFPGADAKLRQSVEAVVAKMTAMAAHEMFGYLDWISKQILVSTAEDEELERHGGTWGINRKPSTTGSGTIQFTGTNGTTIQAGAILRRADNVEYILDHDVTIAGSVGTGTVTALIAGVSGNAIAGVKANLTSPVAGVQSQATVSGEGIVAGTDAETYEALRSRIIARIQEPPHGGAEYDYKAWALEVPGVTRAWPYAQKYGLGTVGLTFVMDNKPGTIIPSSGDVAAVQAHVSAKCPITADLTVFAPTAVPVNIEIHLMPNTLAVQNAIKAEIEDFFRREAYPGGTLFLSRLNEAISTAKDEFDHVLITPNANVVMTFGQMPVIGTYTWANL